MAKANNINESDSQFPVVGIGASAGGLDAVRIFLKALPKKTGMAFVFVQHLSPDHESILPELLQKVTPFPVRQITDNLHLEKDNLYIIPQNKVVTATDGILKLTDLDKGHKKPNTIDVFFSSLGVVHQSFAVGIVLSGALSDGTLGLQVIKAHGGLTFAQDEGSAAFDSMPKSAVQAGVVDFILPPEQIAEQLIKINYPFHSNYTSEEKDYQMPEADTDTFKQILTVLRVRRGVDFSYYKKSTLKRRIIRRMALSKIEKPLDYLVFLRESKVEQDALYNDMLISVTQFFRDSQSFDVLCGTILPSLLEEKNINEPFRIWIAGCATGEEAYSMAMCIQEYLGDKATAIKIQIFATDISETAINKARTGIYRQSELEGVSASRLAQFFIKLDGNFQVTKSIRDMCVFAHHNLLKDPPFSKIDLVSCRNVLIYLEPVLQKRALTTFHYSLKENGYLVLGKSETIGINTDIFAPYNSSEKIYLRKGPVGRFMNVSSPGREQTFRDIDKGAREETENKDVYKVADEVMLRNFMPPSVLVNEKFDIVQFRGITETWLVPPMGKPSFNVIKMAREGLAFELRNLLHLAKKTNVPARKFAVFFKVNGLQHFVNLQAVPLKATTESFYLVVFQTSSEIGLNQIPPERNSPQEHSTYNIGEMRIEQLEKELTQARADMRSITEEQETANEELQSANEELLSGSEELQSLNEELETSKEELQSTNEEIMIVNKELIDRNDQLNNSRLYTEGIVSTIRDSLIILDADLRIKRATGGFYEKFRTNEQETEGLYIYQLGNGQWDIPKLRVLLENLLPEKKVLTDYEVVHVFPALGKRTMCLNARQIDNINGEKLILLAFEDITDKRKVEQGLAEAESLLSESRERLKFAIDSAGLGTWDYDPENKILRSDKRCREIFDLPLNGELNLSSYSAKLHPADRLGLEKQSYELRDRKNSGEFDVEFRIFDAAEKTKWLKAKGKVYLDERGLQVRFIGTLMDITVQKLIDEATRQLLIKKDEFISIASHELKTPITSLKAMLQMTERTMPVNENYKQPNIFVTKAIRQVNKLIELIRDLLDVTKIQSGMLELRKNRFLLDDLITECCEELQGQTQRHKIVIDGETNIEVFADRNRLEQVIINLLSNAIKYSPDHEQVTISVNKADKGVKVSIIDHGIGIPQNKLPFIFDRFYRVDEDSRNYAGLGLGLFISSEIIKQHNSTINITSEEEKGSTFWFIIPEEE